MIKPPHLKFERELFKFGFQNLRSVTGEQYYKLLASGWGVAIRDPLFAGLIADASFLHLSPEYVFRPITIDQIQIIVRLVRKFDFPLTIASGKTGLSAGYANPGVIIDGEALKTLPEPIHLDVISGIVRVDQSVLVGELITSIPYLTQNQWIFPVQPSSAFKLPVRVGGLIGTDASGIISGQLGSIHDWIRHLTVLLPNGKISEIAPNDPNFNLMIGENGRFGIVLSAEIALTHPPINPQTMILYGENLSNMMNGLQAIQEQQILPFINEFILSEQPLTGLFTDFFDQSVSPPKWVILLKGTSSDLERFNTVLQSHTQFWRTSVSAIEFKKLLEERTSIALQTITKDDNENPNDTYLTFPGFEDVLVKPNQLSIILTEINQILHSHGFPSVLVGYGHLNFRRGQGILLHIRFPIPLSFYSDQSENHIRIIAQVIAEINLALKDRFGIRPKAEHTPGILYPWLVPEKVAYLEVCYIQGTAFRCPALNYLHFLQNTIPGYRDLPIISQFSEALFGLLQRSVKWQNENKN